MKKLSDCREEIHSCSKCGLCQSVCPIYKITGNDCTVSRGHFIMLKGLIKGELKMSKTINKYLDLCLKCGACSKFCPSGIDVVDIVSLAKAEYFKSHKTEKLKSYILNIILKGLKFINSKKLKTKQKSFEKKVIYFAGCGGVNSNPIKILNSLNIEVITPSFKCCGFPFFVRGDMDSFNEYMNDFYKVLESYPDYDIVTNCATCEKTLKSYTKWGAKEARIKNIFTYIRENNLKPELKKNMKITFHKPCNLDNFEDVKWVIENTKNLDYIEMEEYDKCCGVSALTNIKEYKIMSELFKNKHKNIIESGAKTVLTSCLACKITLSLFSFCKYKVQDFMDFLGKNLK